MGELLDNIYCSLDADLLREALASVSVGACIVDDSGRYMLVNPRFCAIYGYEQEQLIGSLFYSFMPDDARSSAIALHNALLETGKDQVGEWEALTGGGEHLRLSLRSRRIVSTDGRRFRVSTVASFVDYDQIDSEFNALSEVVAQSSHGVIVTDAMGRVTWVNNATTEMTGFSLSDMRGRKPGDLLQGEGSDRDTIAYMACQLAAGEGFEVEILNYMKSGQPFHLRIFCSPVRDRAGLLQGFMALQTDTTESRRSREKMLKLSSYLQRLSVAVDQSPASIIMTNVDGVIEYVNNTCLRITGYSRDELIGKNPRLFQSGRTPNLVYTDLWATISSGRTWHGRLVNRRKDGSEYIEWASISPALSEDGDTTCYIAVKEDVTEREELSSRLKSMERFDPLTGLVSRIAFFEAIERRLAELSGVDASQMLAVINIDRFHSFNDLYGHEVGDCLLQSFAGRLRSMAPENSLIARIGPDEFAVLPPTSGFGVEFKAKKVEPVDIVRVLQALQSPVYVNTRSVKPSVSIGVASFLRQAGVATSPIRPGEILRMAESALQNAKAKGGGTVVFFDAEASSKAQEALRLEQYLAEALDRGELFVALQAQVDSGQRLTGAELLLRWEHPILGVISPNTFIPVAEENGQIILIGRWVLCQAVAVLKRLQTINPMLTLSVNISPVQIRDQEFLSDVSTLLANSGISPSGLILEITENVFMSDPELSLDRLESLHQLGVGIAIDDFGTGYSSLSYLKRLPVTELKIDQSFVAGLPDDDADAALVKIIISAADVLDLRVVAEGVETEAQEMFFSEMPGVFLQGYLFDRPLAADAWIEKWRDHMC